MLLAVKSMGSESTEAWHAVLDDLIKRGLRRPEFLIVDGAAGLDQAPECLNEEITADYTDMIYAATPEEIETRRNIRKWCLKHRAVADSLEG